jgi:hypothetical protein
MGRENECMPHELEEEKTYFGLPVLKRKAPLTTSQPHQPRSFGANVITTREIYPSDKETALRTYYSPLKSSISFK